MTKIDPDFPLFVLSAVVVRREDYVETVLPSIADFKLRYWDHEGVNLHSRDIRKAEGAFAFLTSSEKRKGFLRKLSDLMEALPFHLFVVGIRKADHLKRYGPSADNPYELALKFVMERIVFFLESKKATLLPIIAEARGKNEDNELRAAFYQLTTQGTRYVDEGRFRSIRFPLLFHYKRRNIVGIQLADLCAHPSARHILKADQPNQAFEIVERHLYQEGGWKVFP